MLSVVLVVIIVMVLIYSLSDRKQIFTADSVWSKQQLNAKSTYEFRKWEEYGYLDYVNYTEYLGELVRNGELDADTQKKAGKLGATPEKCSETTKEYVQKFTQLYESKGYTVEYLDAVYVVGTKIAQGGQAMLFAHKDKPVMSRVLTYFSSLITIDNIHNVKEDIGERGIKFSWHDPLYGEDVFSPTIIGNGTTHKYLLYCDSNFPYIHQNMLTVNLGKSYAVRYGVDVVTTMLQTQGEYVKSTLTYPTGLVEDSADDLHTATYVAGSREKDPFLGARFTDDYTSTITVNVGKSRMALSFLIGLLSVFLAYFLGVPLGIIMARSKDKFIDKLGSAYIAFIIAVPSLCYIFMFKSIGGSMGLPTTYDINSHEWVMYVLPVISLALPSVANLMKWLRRYMIDQMNSDYVKFARSGGLSEGEIFTKHVLKNAIIPIVHGIPGSLLGCLTGAIITERVYSVPGTGNLLTTAINAHDNSVIVGVTFFYAVLSITAIIMGDILMSMVDPRISFSSKAR